MSGQRGIDGPALALALFVAAALVAALGLSWLATPAGFSSRMEKARARIETAEAALRKAPRTAYAADVICAQADREATTLKSELQSGASAVSVTLNGLSVAASPGAPGATIAPLDVQFDASGPYDKVIAFMGSLARAEPRIFVDSADLTSQVATVDLKFAGRVYCSARP